MSDPIEVSIEYPNATTENAAWVTPLGSNQYRLAINPPSFMFIEDEEQLQHMPHYGDIIEAEVLKPNTLKFVRVIKRANLKRYEMLISQKMANSAKLKEILSKVELEGGYWERFFGGMLTIFVPENGAFDPTEAISCFSRMPNSLGLTNSGLTKRAMRH